MMARRLLSPKSRQVDWSPGQRRLSDLPAEKWMVIFGILMVQRHQGTKERSTGGTSKTSRSQRQSGTQKAFLSTVYHINVKWVDILTNYLSVIRERPRLWVRVGGAFEYGTLYMCVLFLQCWGLNPELCACLGKYCSTELHPRPERSLHKRAFQDGGKPGQGRKRWESQSIWRLQMQEGDRYFL